MILCLTLITHPLFIRKISLQFHAQYSIITKIEYNKKAPDSITLLYGTNIIARGTTQIQRMYLCALPVRDNIANN